jgi:cytochrome b involved in lipid metabolism
MTKVISKEELAKHKSDKDYWIAIHGKVYDVSKYLDDHPGGADVLTEAAGLFFDIFTLPNFCNPYLFDPCF